MSDQKQVQRFGAAVLMDLPETNSDTRQWWIDHNEERQRVLAVFSKIPSPKLEVWKTIKIGTGIKDANGFRQAIKNVEMRIGDWANDMLGKPAFTVATEATEVDLVKVTVGELGFKDGARCDNIYERAKELGLELCPPEVGPQLRLQYNDQPLNEWVLIGMESIRNSGGDLLGVFGVGRNVVGLWLGSDYGGPGGVWGADYRWVFVRPRKCQ